MGSSKRYTAATMVARVGLLAMTGILVYGFTMETFCLGNRRPDGRAAS